MKLSDLGLKQDDLEPFALRVVEEAGGEIEAKDAILKVIEWIKRDYRITDEQISQLRTRTREGIEVLNNNIHWARLRLVEKGKLDKNAPQGIWRIPGKKPLLPDDEITKLVQEITKSVERLGQLAKKVKPPPPDHEKIIQGIKEMGEVLGRKVEVKWGLVYKHDCCWKPNPYANPELVWEVCDKGVPEKDIVSLDWAVKNWRAKGILVLFDEADFEKAKKIIPTGHQVYPLKVDDVISLHSLIKAGNIDVLKTILGI